MYSFGYDGQCLIYCSVRPDVGLTKHKITLAYQNECIYFLAISQAQHLWQKTCSDDDAVCIIIYLYLKCVPFKLQIGNVMNIINYNVMNMDARSF